MKNIILKSAISVVLMAFSSQAFAGRCALVPVPLVIAWLTADQMNSNKARTLHIKDILRTSTMSVATRHRYVRILKKLKDETYRASRWGIGGLFIGTALAIGCGLSVDSAHAATIAQDPHSALQTNEDFRFLADQVGIDRAVEAMEKIANGIESHIVLEEVLGSLDIQD